jgi:hypothetical protein
MTAPIEDPTPTGRGPTEWIAVVVVVLLFFAMVFAFGRGFRIW